MTYFVAHENPKRTGDDTLICLPERFSWLAFLLPPVWAIAKGLWGILVVILVMMTAILLANKFVSLPVFSVYLLGAWWLGFEASSLQSATLERRGWTESGLYFAQNLMLAERKFFGRKRRFLRRQTREDANGR